MRKIILFIGLMQWLHVAYAQDRLRVPLNMLLQIKVPIQPNDTIWKRWNYIPNPKRQHPNHSNRQKGAGFSGLHPPK